MKIAMGSDHAGFPLKEEIKKVLLEQGYEVEDVGCYSPERFDYAISAQKACDLVVNGTCEKAILCCGTGIGISMAANKVKGIRAACCSDYFSAKYTRAHNDANVLCMGDRVVGAGLALELVQVFLTTPFEGGRHQTRIDQIMDIGSQVCHCEEAEGRRGNLGKALPSRTGCRKNVQTACVCSGAHCAAVGGFAALRMRRALYGR